MSEWRVFWLRRLALKNQGIFEFFDHFGSGERCEFTITACRAPTKSLTTNALAYKAKAKTAAAAHPAVARLTTMKLLNPFIWLWNFFRFSSHLNAHSDNMRAWRERRARNGQYPGAPPPKYQGYDFSKDIKYFSGWGAAHRR
jgi:hypothetical protein